MLRAELSPASHDEAPACVLHLHSRCDLPACHSAASATTPVSFLLVIVARIHSHSHVHAAVHVSARRLARLPSQSWSCIIPNARASTHSTDQRPNQHRAHFTHEHQSLFGIHIGPCTLKPPYRSEDEQGRKKREEW